MGQQGRNAGHRTGNLDRRALIKGTAAAVAAGAIADATSAGTTAQGKTDPMSTRAFRAQDGATPGVESMSVADLQAALGNGEMTVRQLVQACLDRIAELDGEGPALNAVIELNPGALAIADELDAELQAGTPRSPFHGIPVLIKDNIATADGMETTAGSLALVGLKPVEDSTVARLLREAGAVILGKTNLSEWANIRSFQSTSGWSGRGGQTLNPYQLDRNPSGSSSGSAAAVAAGYVPVSIGTETNGSIVSPAGHCGVVGIKPTVGLVSRFGVIPISHSQDTIGSMARSVADAAALLNVLAVQDEEDPAQGGPSFQAAEAVNSAAPATAAIPEDQFPVYPPKPAGGVPVIDYTAELDPSGLQGARIGVLRSAVGFSPLADKVFDDSLAALREAGAEVIDPVEMPSAAEISSTPDGLELLLWELKADLAAYFTRFLPPDSPIRSLADVIAFNNAHPEEEMPYFDQSLFLLAEAKTGLDDPEYIAAASRLQQLGRANGIDAVLREYQLDAIVAPTNAPSTKIDLVNGDHFLGGSSTPAAIAGYPLITVPAGYRFGLPVGVTFMGTAYSEATLVRLAYAFEQRIAVWQPPEFVPGSVIPPEPDPDVATPAR
ncbi:MAG TPA: amidase family protein [Thermomicrobiales bacterium]|nr:amidase family protein [Thermomicrobiales bacterium]